MVERGRETNRGKDSETKRDEKRDSENEGQIPVFVVFRSKFTVLTNK